MSKKVIIWIVVIIVALVAIYFISSQLMSSQPAPVSTGQNQAQTTPAPVIPVNTVTPVTTTVTSVKTVTTVTTVPAKTYSIVAVNFSFNPNALTINKGDTVVWTNNDSAPHQIAGDDGLNGQPMSKGQTYSHTYNTAGMFNFHCAIHPAMTGIITVK